MPHTFEVLVTSMLSILSLSLHAPLALSLHAPPSVLTATHRRTGPLVAAIDEPRRCGLLCVGLAGNNGVTLVAGQLATQLGLTWESSRDGPKQAECLGCITQVGALARQHPEFAAFGEVVVGGWDVVPTGLGDALYASRILDYDLVRQVRDEMNEWPVMKGVFDPDFVGDSQHAGATHVRDDVRTRAEQLAAIRADIVSFKRERGVDGHCTMIWSASVERPSDEYATAEALLSAIEADDREVSPSLVYAAAAVLEGCSFVNGGSQNTVQPGMVELAAQQAAPCYVLGTDFKAGQTKAKTAIVEYLRALGLRPRTIASYNHLGNNDMKNLLSPRTWEAKARVKTDIFAPWTEADGPIDHKVAVLYTEQMGDEKRDTVEYTSEGFLGSEHTMFTYTRAMDSALCVPLMIDAAVFCEHLAARRATAQQAGRALAYLFKLNEGAATGVDPGFFHQSAQLAEVLTEVADVAPTSGDAVAGAAGVLSAAGVRGGVVCAGLSCLDMQLLGASEPTSAEAIARFDGCATAPGGSTSNTASALRSLGVAAAVLSCVGADAHGAELERAWARDGIDTSLLLRRRDVSTSLAVLPVFAAGGRGCWVDLSANDQLTADAVLGALRGAAATPAVRGAAALHVGYPHLLRHLRGDGLARLLAEAATLMAAADGDGGDAPLLSLDINGATLGAAADADGVLGASLARVDVLHANLEEACHVAGVAPPPAEADATPEQLRRIADAFTSRGVGVVAITLGAAGAYVAVSPDAARLQRSPRLAAAARRWSAAEDALLPAAPTAGTINANGAGDAFVAGLLAAMLWSEPLSLTDALHVALESARQRIDSAAEPRAVAELLKNVGAADDAVAA